MTEDYFHTLRKQLKGFSREEQEALIEEIRSHVESGERDPKHGKDIEQRRKSVMNELGSPNDLGRGFEETYRPNRLIDFLLIMVPYFLYPYLNSLYNNLIPKYSWADIRLDILLHLPLVAIGVWRRSAPLTLFWITILVSQLFIITLQMAGYYGTQTIIWALLLLALLALAGSLIWKHRNDLLILVFGLMPLFLCILGRILSTLHLTDYSLSPFGQSLLIISSDISSMSFYGTMVAMALFFLPTNRQIRWVALLMNGLLIGLSRGYLDNVFAEWVNSVWVILPLIIVFLGWWMEYSKGRKLKLAISL